MGKGRNSVPDRWEEYSNMGRQIPGTRFIAFKVPLRESILCNMEAGIRVSDFTPRTLRDHCTRLGLVLDLTNTDRYYDPEEFRRNGIEHVKLKTEGHIIPKTESFKMFSRAVEKFLEKNKENNKLIGVHCTHGLNRTGYMVCRFMIQKLKIAPDQAIADFNSARGHVQERENYLADLRQAPWIHDNYYSEDENENAKGGGRGRRDVVHKVHYSTRKDPLGSESSNWRSAGPQGGYGSQGRGEGRDSVMERLRRVTVAPEGTVGLGTPGKFSGNFDSGAFTLATRTMIGRTSMTAPPTEGAVSPPSAAGVTPPGTAAPAALSPPYRGAAPPFLRNLPRRPDSHGAVGAPGGAVAPRGSRPTPPESTMRSITGGPCSSSMTRIFTSNAPPGWDPTDLSRGGRGRGNWPTRGRFATGAPPGRGSTRDLDLTAVPQGPPTLRRITTNGDPLMERGRFPCSLPRGGTRTRPGGRRGDLDLW
ncbi:uncharacterized protein LOC143017897 isoform X1 [Oratosquilla oratoria]|uniref:uncharacterized protein LOC143017897 isoform X1 n=1 Tax=Oratosquilla oratoria TaxID=337810 RepID=UPI003F77444B